MKSIKDIDFNQLNNKSFWPSPLAWEDEILYFLMLDRFSNGLEKNDNLYKETDKDCAIKSEEDKTLWLESGEKWLGGNLKGLRSKLNYLKDLGITTIWISPVFKQPAFSQNYHGYGIQDFLEIDPHFGSKEELKDLVKEAHSMGLYIMLDIIINHTGDVFEYQEEGIPYNGSERPIKGFRDKKGNANIPFDNIDFDNLSKDDGIWPKELMTQSTFSRKGFIEDWENKEEFLDGDFFTLKDIHLGQGDLGDYQPSQALKILSTCFKYWIAYLDIDGYRLDTVKHLDPGATRYFLREIHEFAISLGKNNFYIIGEITGGLDFAMDIKESTGVDAALGINAIPETLENVAKGYLDPDQFFNLFKNSDLKGDVFNKWYRNKVVSMFDDHDMVTKGETKGRFSAEDFTKPLLLNTLILNLLSPGIPCIYYGTEQGFDGSGNHDKYIRETMFESPFGAFRTKNKQCFNKNNEIYKELAKIIEVRQTYLPLKKGQLYQREISYDGALFEFPHKISESRHTGIIAWSRFFNHEEIIIAINCHLEDNQKVHITIDGTEHNEGDTFKTLYSSDGKVKDYTVEIIDSRLCIALDVPVAGAIIIGKTCKY